MTEIEKMPLESMDIKENQLEKLKEIFPEVFTEGNSIDWDKLRLSLGKDIDTGKERFGMVWPGKADCFKTIQQPSIGTLIPVRIESIEFDSTKNMFIEGDNLEALKLLQKSYLGKIKIMYFDPPYNTGKDFIYPDNYSESLDTYLEYTGQVDSEGRKFSTNPDTDGRFHSKWLNMMYPRLFLAKNLLHNEGVIFISIDNAEVTNLRTLCNEIFGEENFIECITWNKRVPKNDKGIGNIHEYVLIYVKDKNYKHQFVMQKKGLEEIDELLTKLKKQGTTIIEAEKEIKKLYNKKSYDRGITLYNSLDENYKLWGKINMSWPNAETFGPRYLIKHPKTGKPVKVPERGWRWVEDTFNEAAKIVNDTYQEIKELHDGSIVCGRIWFDKNENTQPSSIIYLEEVDTLLLRSILSMKSDGGIEVENLFEGKSFFSYPKPSSLIKTLIGSLKETQEDIILDIFAGSATTAHAVLDLNFEDSGQRKFICVQLPEPTEEKSEAYKAGYRTIADIGKDRIRRVIQKIKKDIVANNGLFNEKAKPDLGFKVFKLSQSNFKTWNTDVDKTPSAIQEQLFKHIDHISPEAQQEAILYEILLKSGFELTTYIEKLEIEGKTLFSIAEGEMLVCLEKDLNQELIKAIAERKASRVICLDEGFHNNDQLKTNAVQIMKSKGVVKFQTV
jgi:adenine-specific DNA-methyltransferase